jgi:GT2 family glycosyltransferase
MDIYKNITLIIVSYKSESLIQKNIETIKKFQTIIVENSSSNKIDKLVNGLQNIKLLKFKKNLGYGTANNFAVSESETPYVLIVNPDVYLEEKYIDELYNAHLRYGGTSGILGPALYDKNYIRRTNGSVSYLKIIKKYKISDSKNNLPTGDFCCEFLVGCCYLIKKDLFLSVGGFDKDFFMYFEDNDLCDRIIKKGKSIIEVPSAKFVHLENASSKKNFLMDTKLSIIHKVSFYIYLKKNVKFYFLLYCILINFFDFLQRCIFNLCLLKFKKSFKNLLRIFSIFLFLTSLYRLLY